MHESTGIQVLISSYNSAEYLNDCFASIESAMAGYNWMMIFCDDASADNTKEIIDAYKLTTTASQVVYQKYQKSLVVGQAKNRACFLSLDYKNDFPVICFMDSDDVMGAERISGLLPHLSEDQPFVYGDFKVLRNQNGEWVDLKLKGFNGLAEAETRLEHLNFGPWSTLIHSNLIPEDGVFFRQDIENYDDILTWWQMKYEQNVNITAVSGFITNYHKYRRTGSLSGRLKEEDPVILKELFKLKWAIHPVPNTESPFTE
jgi:glycosyltransferase involved in cell wall biosynthesis